LYSFLRAWRMLTSRRFNIAVLSGVAAVCLGQSPRAGRGYQHQTEKV
jgi:hypothetical protein